MTVEPSAQRAYRAACPNCGAPVEFRSAASAFAVCSFCKSTIVREGDALRRIGESAELFDDHSPLQLGAAGRYQGAPFTLVGRLQYRYADGTWNEWHALFDGGADHQKSGWLSEDNGRYVIAFDAPWAEAIPSAESLQPGAPLVVSGQVWTVASVASARVIAALGELPSPPELTRAFPIIDLRNPRGEVGTLDYSDAARPRWAIGRSVALSDLAMTGLSEIAEKTLSARGAPCPNCGAALQVKLSTTQTIVCDQCHAVVDVSAGVGADMQHYAQANGTPPLLALGSVGTLALGKAALPWQVVGYAERCEVANASDDDDDEQTFWREYLLYHRHEGFAFIVDAQDGWSWAAPITGVPERFGESVKHNGVLYRKLYDYTGRATYVLGEFYWQLRRNQTTVNTDYQGTGSASAKRLNREQTRSGSGADATAEVVWSAGETLAADTVMQAFRIAPTSGAAFARDALPTALNGSSLRSKLLLGLLVLFVGWMLFRCASRDDCSETRAAFGESSQEYRNCVNRGGGFRTGGGSFGGFSSGGGHK